MEDVKNGQNKIPFRRILKLEKNTMCAVYRCRHVVKHETYIVTINTNSRMMVISGEGG